MTPAAQRSARTLASLRGSRDGRRAVILANGPSLLSHDLSRLAQDVIVIGCNRSWQVAPRPDFHLVVEPRHLTDHPEVYAELHRHGRLVVAGSRSSLPYGLRIDLLPAVRGKRGSQAFSFDLTHGAVLSVDGNGSVVYVALQFAAWLGIGQCHVLGLDLAGEHFHGAWPPSPALIRQNALFLTARDALRGRMAVYVCGSPESRCEAFPQSSFEEVC